MIFACDRGDCVELRAAQSATELPGRWHEVVMPIAFVSPIGLDALERGKVIRFTPEEESYADLLRLYGNTQGGPKKGK
jgi:hypothetical protein